MIEAVTIIIYAFLKLMTLLVWMLIILNYYDIKERD